MTSTLVDRLAGIAEGVALKAACRVATDVNIALNALQAIGGFAIQEGDRVLVRAQDDATENGIYNASSGNWTRSPDFDGPRDVISGTLVPVTQGSGFGAFWILTAADPIVIGTSELIFGSFSGSARSSRQVIKVSSGASFQIPATALLVDVNKDVGSATNLLLPPSATFAMIELQIKDGRGDAGTHNITVVCDGTDLIDGQASIVLRADSAQCLLAPRDEGGWYLLSYG